MMPINYGPESAPADAPPDAQALRDVALGDRHLLALVKLVAALRNGSPVRIAEALDYADRVIAGQP